MNMKCIEKIVRASGVKAGENVLVHFWGDDTEKEIANNFVAAVAAAGGSPVLLQQSRSVNREIFSRTSEEAFGEDYFERLSSFDAVLDVFAYRPIVLGYELEPEKMELYRRYIRRLFGALMKAKRFAQIRIPTQENAEESGLEPDDYIRRMEAAYDIGYGEVAKACREKISEMEGMKEIIICTGDGCALHMNIGGRKWHADAGDGDMPCGEVYIAPVENFTHGSVFFDRLHIEDLGAFENVTLVAENGRITGADVPGVDEFVKNLPDEGRVVCEFGLGMNPGVTDACGYTLLDEKMAGSFHIALGANNMFGGENQAEMHIDLVNGGKFSLKTK